LAKAKFNFEKRQKEIAKKKKKEQKNLDRRARKDADSTEASAAEPHDTHSRCPRG